MRDQLRDLEGQLVYVLGRPTGAKTSGANRDVCFKNATVVPWDADAAITDSKGIKCDHLWIRAHSQTRTSMYQNSIVVSRVGFYTRKDGSLDIGCQSTARLYNADISLSRLNSAMRQRISQQEALTRSAGILLEMNCILKSHGKMFEGDPVYAYSEYMSITDIKKQVEHFQKTVNSLQARIFLDSVPKASKPEPGSALFLDRKPVYSSPFASSVDRLLEG
jgi:hypothetical protein